MRTLEMAMDGAKGLTILTLCRMGVGIQEVFQGR